MKNLVIVLAVLLSQTSLSQKTVITPKKKKEIKEYIKHFENNNQLMGTISIFENGNEVINETFGETNKNSITTKNRKYTIGSITKLYVAVLFAKLQEEGKINSEEKLINYFPKISNSNKITIKQMLNHTSGLKDYTSKSDSLHFWLKEPRTKKEIMDEIIAQGVEFQPGDSLKYSNSAYYLLGRILEKKHHKPFAQIITDEITTPLHLTNTFAIAKDSKYENIAKSYEKKREKWVEMEEFYFPNAFSAGSIASTAFDMNTFLDALFTHKIIKKETLQTMLPKNNAWFGLGIMKVPFYNYINYGHRGDTYGTHAIAIHNINNKISLTYIINGENYPTNNFAIGLMNIIYDKEYTLPTFKEYIPEKRFFELYEGTYVGKGLPISLKIYKKDKKLMAQGKGQPALTLNPVEKHVFDFKKAGLKIEFKPFDNKLILQQAGRIFELTKNKQ